MFKEFISTYGMEMLYALITAIAGYVALAVKNIVTKYINDKTKKDVARTVVQAVEQIYKDLNGAERLEKALASASEMLNEKGIGITEVELRMLLESAVGEFNEVFKKQGDVK